jgi:hypothetical protein
LIHNKGKIRGFDESAAINLWNNPVITFFNPRDIIWIAGLFLAGKGFARP